MLNTLKKALFGVIAVGIVLIVVAWLLLESSVFSGLRRDLVQEVLTEQIGQPLIINGDVRITLGAASRVHASGIILPSVDIKDVNLAELDLLEVDVDSFGLLQGKVDLDELFVEGLRVLLLTETDERTSWVQIDNTALAADETHDKTEATAQTSRYLTEFLKQRAFRFSKISLLVDQRPSGFEFAFDLNALNHEHADDGQMSTLSSDGQVNGQPFAIEGTFPKGGQFSVQAEFEGLIADYEGTSTTDGDVHGHQGQLSVQIESVAHLLKILKLEAPIDGQATLSAALDREEGKIEVRDLELQTDFADGSQFTVSGDISNMITVDGLDLLFDARLYPEGHPPKQAEELKDLKLERISAHILSTLGEIKFENILVESNSIDETLKDLGPMSVGKLVRSPEGKIELRDIKVEAGSPDEIYLAATGNVLNLLEVSDLAFSGSVQAPASLALGRNIAEPEAFGHAVATFEVTDEPGFLALPVLTFASRDTELWHLDGKASVGRANQLDTVDVAVDLRLPDSDGFLRGLGFEPDQEGGAFGLNIGLQGADKGFETSLGLSMRDSLMTADWSTRFQDGVPTIDGRIYSAQIEMADVASAIATVIDLGQLDAKGPASKKSRKTDRELKPLVLAEENKTEPEGEAKAEDKPALKPLVLPQSEPKVSDLLNFEKMLAGSDVNIAIDIEKIHGQQGISSIKSALVVSQGNAELGPLEFAYGKGQVSVSAGIDLINRPNRVRVSGSTGGWDFGNILDAVGAGIAASGRLYGRFELAGGYKSARQFADTASGWAHISLKNGKIGTSLLDLAGLGVIPWLFSKELQKGYTQIVCLEAPINVNAGQVSFDKVVVETQSVQIVAKGAVNWKADQINIRGEPRPVGKPLARTPWPFEVKGRLSAPQFELAQGKTRRRTDGGAATPQNRVPCKPDVNQLR